MLPKFTKQGWNRIAQSSETSDAAILEYISENYYAGDGKIQLVADGQILAFPPMDDGPLWYFPAVKELIDINDEDSDVEEILHSEDLHELSQSKIKEVISSYPSEDVGLSVFYKLEDPYGVEIHEDGHVEFIYDYDLFKDIALDDEDDDW